MDILVLYYSFSGRTRAVAEELAKELGADLREIECPTYRRWYGRLAMAWDIASGHQPNVLPLGSPGTYYDLIVVGGPVWAARAAPPVMRALNGCGRHFKRTGLFVSCAAARRYSRPQDAIAEMSRAMDPRTAPTYIFRTTDVGTDAIAGEIREFSTQLRGVGTRGGATRSDPDHRGWDPLHWPSIRAKAPAPSSVGPKAAPAPQTDPTSGPLHSV